ncbi:hypothetical protein Q5P01_006904 [Channa striata]|uniref:Uncharacterized protein n=1 Tax=Channa striata TaxID=64152 RepID=A0AA88NIP6_CHASR|nr:hypothetical protein Q5P01_006904 [Channa striata]
MHTKDNPHDRGRRKGLYSMHCKERGSVFEVVFLQISRGRPSLRLDPGSQTHNFNSSLRAPPRPVAVVCSPLQLIGPGFPGDSVRRRFHGPGASASIKVSKFDRISGRRRRNKPLSSGEAPTDSLAGVFARHLSDLGSLQ